MKHNLEQIFSKEGTTHAVSAVTESDRGILVADVKFRLEGIMGGLTNMQFNTVLAIIVNSYAVGLLTRLPASPCSSGGPAIPIQEEGKHR